MKNSFNVALLAAGALACGGPEGYDNEIETATVSSELSPYDTRIAVTTGTLHLGSVDDGGRWTANYSGSVSGFQTGQCRTADNRLATLIRGHRETGSLDNYMAKLVVGCNLYEGTFNTDDYQIVPGTFSAAVAYEGPNFESTSHTSVIAGGNKRVAVGIDIRRHNQKYVKDMRIVQASTSGISTFNESPRSWAFGLSGSIEQLRCASGSVLVGIQVKESTNNGKIRDIRLMCSPLKFQERGWDPDNWP